MSEDGFGLAKVKVEGGIYFPDGRAVLPGDPDYAKIKAEQDARDAGDHITLPSGRKFYANNLIVGIDDQGRISEGYDGGVSDDEFTAAERIELADLMIERWTEYKRRAESKKCASR